MIFRKTAAGCAPLTKMPLMKNAGAPVVPNSVAALIIFFRGALVLARAEAGLEVPAVTWIVTRQAISPA
jgi:hypothetical protein